MAFSPSSVPGFFPLLIAIIVILQLQSYETQAGGLALPLRTQKLQSLSTPHPPSKLRFHRNVSLTVTIAVGTPPQNVTMVLDTGSELSWLLCDTGPLSQFRPRASSSYAPIPCSSPTCKSQTRDLPNLSSCDSATHNCHVSLTYADASTAEGTLVSDLFLVGGPPARRTNLRCQSSPSSAGDTTAAGMLGMNRGSLSFVAQTKTSRFSYCISDRDAGVLLLGPSNIVPLNYTPLVQISLPLPYFDRVAYSVQLETIRVGAKTLPIPKSVLLPDHTGAGQTMVDSGTQFSFLLGQAYEILKDEFLRQTSGVLNPEKGYVFQGAFDTCFRATQLAAAAAVRRIPAVVLGFQGAEVAGGGGGGGGVLHRVEGERRGNNEGVWCFTFGNSDLVPMEAYVIGHHHQQNIWVEYDLENSRVGFAPVQCDLASRKLGVML
ncbi:LOW QUALITY PROTEIN: aspartic proteinase PCS1-like [Phalaenopsis equestris]|uniref:LOW QUALITY PROTEIN: aspartic proteinase PCS1-like n=1 Tax=Phalaenopsis equestris TaxID=78828 RepID=UPI0009E39349|nr:LOW QUALITY PROTEIN: aspartic proteinase PCS1-like [Phalaenopsis equestris]